MNWSVGLRSWNRSLRIFPSFFQEVLDDRFTIEQVGHRLAVPVDIADHQTEQLADAATSRDAEYEKPAVADLLV